MVTNAYNAYMNGGFLPGDITILTFYKEQRNLIKQRMTESVPVLTVDKAQGHENTVIILNTVNTVITPNNWAMFIDDIQRVGVAISRARTALLIIGNKKLLQSTKTFGTLITEQLLTQIEGDPTHSI